MSISSDDTIYDLQYVNFRQRKTNNSFITYCDIARQRPQATTEKQSVNNWNSNARNNISLLEAVLSICCIKSPINLITNSNSLYSQSLNSMTVSEGGLD